MSRDDMLEGYLDGTDPSSPEPSGNRSESYVHGFLNGRDDLKGIPRDSAHNLRLKAAEILRREDKLRTIFAKGNAAE